MSGVRGGLRDNPPGFRPFSGSGNLAADSAAGGERLFCVSPFPGPLDGLDIRIIHAMGIQPYGREPKPVTVLRPSSIAKRLSVSTERVADRLARMEKAGIIAGYEIYPNLRHLGLEASWYSYQFRDDDAADKAMAKLAAMEGVSACCAFLGGVLCVGLFYRSPLDHQRKLRLLAALAGEATFEKLYDLDMPRVHRPLSSLDWRVVHAMRGDPMRPLVELAKALAVSSKTVRRHIDRLGAEGSFFIVPEVDPSRVEGLLVFLLAFRFDAEAGPAAVAEVERALQGHFVSKDVTMSRELGTCALLIYATSMAEAERLRRKGASLPGVAKVQALMVRDAAGDFEWLDEAIGERATASRR